MRILYVNSIVNHGLGGHSYSMKYTAKAMMRRHEVFISTIGPVRSPLWDDMPRYMPIICNPINPVAVFAVKQIIKNNRIDVIHVFDKDAYWPVRIASMITKTPVLLTKCGGAPPRGYFPRARHLVLFSQEDMAYFSANRSFRQTNLFHIPNRICSVGQQDSRVARLKAACRPGARIIMRIARFCPRHAKSIKDTICLVHKLKKNGIDCQLVLLGQRDCDVYDACEKMAPPDTLFITDGEYTVNASNVLPVADVVVGTGRGAMEALLAGCVVFAPVSNYDIPVAVSPDNVERFAYYNFSSRTELLEKDEAKEYEKIRRIMRGDAESVQIRDALIEYAHKHFDIEGATDQYTRLYGQCRAARMLAVDLGFHFLHLARQRVVAYLRKDKWKTRRAAGRKI